MSPRTGLDRCGKSRAPPGFDPRTVQPVASRYTDYATLPTPVKVKSNPVTGLVVAQRGGRGIALPFQDLGARRG